MTLKSGGRTAVARGEAARRGRAGERGFSLIESLLAVAVLAFGLLSVAAAFSQGLTTLSGSNLDVLAREKAAEAIESVFTARDTRTITWVQIRNVQGQSGSDGGIFFDGQQPLTRPGYDGLLNTDDDSDEIESLVLPGADGELGTDDDVIQPLTQFSREIEIRDLSPTLRQLRVIIRYTVGRAEREYVLTTYISSYA
jgi:prepilin-type N-terminal cleavage/methylation domain-containing protein